MARYVTFICHMCGKMADVKHGFKGARQLPKGWEKVLVNGAEDSTSSITICTKCSKAIDACLDALVKQAEGG